MTKPLSSGLLLVLEGPDRVGKTTQAHRLARTLEAQGRSVCLSREPGGDQVGELMRELVIGVPMDPWTELFLFLAGRARHIAEVIRPALARGEIVILDRYSPSTLVYQGAVLGDDIVENVTALSVFLVPELTIILDREEPLVPLDSFDRFERSGLLGWEERRRRYLTFAQRFGWPIVSAAGIEDEITSRLMAIVSGLGILQ